MIEQGQVFFVEIDARRRLTTTDDGDVILRAGAEPGSKNDFRVHKFILSLASPVFKDMFAFPQPSNQNHNEQLDIPIVDVPDSPTVLDAILRFVYPGVRPPAFTDLSTVSSLLFAADKYDIVSMRPALKDALRSFIDAEPFRVYIVASRLGFMEEAKAAAKVSTLEAIMLPKYHEKDVRHVSGVDLYRLLWFSKTREDFARSAIRSSASLNLNNYLNPCPVTKHWSDGWKGFYAELEKGVQVAFTKNPCVQFNDLYALLNAIPDPAPGCALGPSGEQIDCPLRPSFIRHHLDVLAKKLNGINDALLKRAFEMEF